MNADHTKSLPVPALNLAGNFAALRDDLLRELTEIAASGAYVLGPKVATFEQNLAAFCGSRFALGLSSGTDALLLALMAQNIGPGDEVLVPTFTFFATAGTVARLGARPVFADVEPDTFNIDVNDARSRLSPRTRAIIPVHLYGQLADMAEITSLAREHSLTVIEDAAQAIAATDGAGRQAGAFGLFGALSFYPTKNLGALGDAGALLTDDEQQFELCRKLRIHGSGHTYFHERVGGNFRIDALQAAVLNVKLAHLARWTDQRRERAAGYTARLTAAGLVPECVRPPVERIGRHVYHQYVIRAQQRDALADFLKSRQIGCGVYYPLPLHLQKCFAGLGGRPGDFPVAEAAAREVLALPIYPELTGAQQDAVVDAIQAFYRR